MPRIQEIRRMCLPFEVVLGTRPASGRARVAELMQRVPRETRASIAKWHAAHWIAGSGTA